MVFGDNDEIPKKFNIRLDIFRRYCNTNMLKCHYIQTGIKGVFELAYYKRLRDLREDNNFTQKQNNKN